MNAGGLEWFINIRWCYSGHVTVKATICCQDNEWLAVSQTVLEEEYHREVEKKLQENNSVKGTEDHHRL